MEKHPDCAEVCQQADAYGVWPMHSCKPECVWLKNPPEPGCSNCGYTEPIAMKPCIYCGASIPEDADQVKPSDYCHHE